MTKASDMQDRIAEDVSALGVRPGGVVLIHSSLSAMGFVHGGPETVILGVLEHRSSIP